ncbi:MAG: hypothetical protein Q4F95_14205 [Oscillospiraceae bacterium]|nr:hypothetical protein [Oscillospiraceae bacterium]
MQFKDEYLTRMNRKKLDDDFIMRLSVKMDIQAGDESEDPFEGNAAVKSGKSTVTVNAVRKNKVFFPAAVAVFALIIMSCAVIKLSTRNTLSDPGNESEAGITPDTTDTATSEATSVSTEKPDDLSAENKQDQTQDTEILFSTQSELLSFADSIAAVNSPLTVGYEAAGYEDAFKGYFKITFTDTGYYRSMCEDNPDSGVNSGNDPDMVITQANKTTLTSIELSQFSQLINYINENVGSSNYYIYDMCMGEPYYRYKDPAEIRSSDNSKSPDIVVSIVLKDQYDKYINNPGNEYVISYMLYDEKKIIIYIKSSDDPVSTDQLQ